MRYALLCSSAALVAAGCAEVVNAPTLTMNVTFQSGSTASPACPPNVTSVEATEQTNALPATTVGCSAMTTAGIPISIGLVPPGTYSMFIQGLDEDQTTWSTTQKFTVTATGSNTFTVPLQPTAGTVNFNFAFAPNTPDGGMTCAEADVTSVSITVDPSQTSAVTTSVPCFDTTTMTDTGQLIAVAPGSHDFDLSASDSSGTKIWDASLSGMQVTAAGPNQFNAAFQGVVTGPLGVALAFPRGISCSTDAGVMQVVYQVVDPDGSMGQSGTTTCNTNTNDITIGSNGNGSFAAGVYGITLQAQDGSGDTLFESAGYPTAAGGIFVLPESLPMTLPVVNMTATSM